MADLTEPGTISIRLWTRLEHGLLARGCSHYRKVKNTHFKMLRCYERCNQLHLILIEEDHLHHEEAVQATRKAMENPNVSAIYEVGFVHDIVRIRVDILERLGNDRWNMIEVKSSTSQKDIYLPDVAVQYHVLKGSGLDVNRVIDRDCIHF